MKISQITSKEIEDIKKSDRLFSQLIKTNKNYIEKLISQFEKQNFFDPDMKDDLRQEAYLSLWNSLFKFEPKRKDGASFSTFAYKCIFNDLLQKVKKSNKVTTKEFLSTDVEDKIAAKFNAKNNNSDSEKISVFDINQINKNKKYNTFHAMEDDILYKVEMENKLRLMNDLDRKIFDLKFNKNLSRQDMAKKLNMNANTFKFMYYHDFRDRMRKLFGEDFIGDLKNGI